MTERDYNLGWIVLLGTVLLWMLFSSEFGLFFVVSCAVIWSIQKATLLKRALGPGLYTIAATLLCSTILIDWALPQFNLFIVSLLCYALLIVLYSSSQNSSQKTTLYRTKKFECSFAVLLSGIVTVGYLIRIYAYDCLPAYRDEEHHVGAVFSLEENDKLNYMRSYLTTFLGRFFLDGDSNGYFEILWAGRKASVITGTLTAIPTYFIGKHVNKTIGLLSAILWTLSPWTIGISQIFREYAHYTLVFALGTWLLLASMEILIKGNKINLKNGFTFLLTIIYVCASFHFLSIKDVQSSFRIVPLIWLAFVGVYFLANAHKLKKSNVILSLVAISILGVVVLMNSKYLSFFLALQIEINPKWIQTYFSSLPTQRVPFHWWTNISTPVIAPFIILLSGFAYSIRTEKLGLYLPIVGTFFFILIAFAIVFLRYFSAKYLFYLMPLYCVLIAVGLRGFIDFSFGARSKTTRLVSLTITFLVAIITFHPSTYFDSVLSPSLNTKQFNPTTGVLHLDKVPAINYIQKCFEPQELNEMALFTNFYEHLATIECSEFRSIIKYNHAHPRRFTTFRSQLRTYDKGLVLIDQKRNTGYRKNFPGAYGKSFLIDNYVFKMLLKDDINHLYSFRKLEPNERPPRKFYYSKVIEREKEKRDKKLEAIELEKQRRGWLGKYSDEYVY